MQVLHLTAVTAREPFGQERELLEIAGRRDAAQVEPQLDGPRLDFRRCHFQIIVRDMRVALTCVALAVSMLDASQPSAPVPATGD